MIQVSSSGSSEQSGDSGIGEKWSDSGSLPETRVDGTLPSFGGRQWMKQRTHDNSDFCFDLSTCKGSGTI